MVPPDWVQWRRVVVHYPIWDEVQARLGHFPVSGPHRLRRAQHELQIGHEKKGAPAGVPHARGGSLRSFFSFFLLHIRQNLSKKTGGKATNTPQLWVRLVRIPVC